MVKPTKKKVLAKMAEIERRVEAGSALQIDVVMPVGQRARVGWGADGLYVLFNTDYARTLAQDFATAAAIEAGADDIGRALIGAADQADMINATLAGRQ